MDAEQVFQTYYGKIKREGVCYALLWALGLGFICAFITAFVCWLVGFTGINGLLVLLAVLVFVTGISTVILYYACYRPTTAKIARRLDKELGLEERIVTMVELRGVQSYMAMVQREDAKNKLLSVQNVPLKFAPTTACFTTLIAAATLGVAMLAICTAAGYTNKLKSPLVSEWEKIPTYTVDYTLGVGGLEIRGDDRQTIEQGSATTQVVAIAQEGYYFLGWNDGKLSPSRSDVVTSENLVFFAYFAPVLGERVEEDPKDSPLDAPPQETGEGLPGQPDDEGDPSKPSTTYEPNNQVIDGETYYRDVFQDYYDEAVAMLQSGQDIPAELKAFLEAYYNILK